MCRGLVDPSSRDQAVGQHPQQFGLCRQRHFSGLVQKESAFVCRFKNSLARAIGAGERSPLVSEQLAFQKRFGERRTIDGDQRLFGTQAAAMNCARDQLLAGSGFSSDEDGSVGWCDARNFLAKLANRRTAPCDL